MLQLFRNFFKSKIGIVVTLAFLGLIALAFASMDVANTGTFGGVTGGDRIAAVGDKRISTADLSTNVTNRVDQIRQQDPRITIQAFVEEGGVQDVLDQMLSRWSLAEFANRLGLRAGDRLVDSEIAQLDAFRGFDGEFDQELFDNALKQRGLNEKTVREDLAMGLLARQLVTPASYGVRVPTSIARRYAQLLGETRSGRIAVFPAALFAPEGDPTDKQLQSFYSENRSDYIRPERRELRYAVMDEAALGDLPAPTQEQIARRYQRDAKSYAEIERRTLTQLVVPTQAAAQAIVNEVKGGISLEAAAQGKGLATTSVPAIDAETLLARSSQEVVDAAFGAAKDSLSKPAQGSLGWYVFRVESISVQPGRSLAAARNEIAEQLATEQRRAAFSEATGEIDDAFSRGSSLTEIAEKYGLEIQETPPLTATGQIYGTQQMAPEALAPVLALAFEMDEGEPQLAAAGTGQQFLLFDVTSITESAAAPLDEIRDEVTAAWRRTNGMTAASQAAARVLKRVEEGKSLVEAAAAEETGLPTPQPITLNRREIARQRQLTPVTMLFFSMAAGTTKRLEQDRSNSWFVVQLDKIEAPEIADDDSSIAVTQSELANLAGDEYVAQFVRAIENGLDIETNQPAIDAVIAQLTGDDR